MNCSVCNRNNAVTLSICPSCGAMINDSVREELIGKISNAPKSFSLEPKENKMVPNKNTQSAKSADSPEPAAQLKTSTTEITTKMTSPTLVEFHSKNTTVPEWRLQLKNVVRQRQDRETVDSEVEIAQPPQRAQLITNGATALKADAVPEPKVQQYKNPTLNSALERIEKSRRQFLAEEKPLSELAGAPAKTGKNFPFYIAAKTNDVVSKPAEVNPPISTFAKPKLATSINIGKEKLDTNKLPPLPKPAETPAKVENPSITVDDTKPKIEVAPEAGTEIVETAKTEIEVTETIKTEVKTSAKMEIAATEEVEIEEFDDCAPFAMRFNAGLFDLIIGSFTSLFLLSPFMLFGGNWLSTAGIFAFLATCSVVMFIYMTTAIGLYGKTFGMRLFSLEIVDIETEDYPSLHQAAVSSAVYLLSLALAGIGFLTIPFNEERRAVHDLVSGTIVIREE